MRQFLLKLLSSFTKSPNSLTPAVNFITPDGTVSRFVFVTRKIKNGIPKPKAFEPEIHPVTKIYETSICGMNTVQVERVNYLGKTIRQDKLAIAAVEIEVNEITKVLLNCLAAPDIENKYPEHGIINGWDQNNKEFRLEKMIELAANFKKIINIS